MTVGPAASIPAHLPKGAGNVFTEKLEHTLQHGSVRAPRWNGPCPPAGEQRNKTWSLHTWHITEPKKGMQL